MKTWTIPVMIGLLSACNQTTNQAIAPQPSTIANIAGINFIEEVKNDSSKIVIPYQKYQLDNGLTVILHQDNSDPLVHVDITYHVGSAREDIGKSGFAHFFEHMMFQGSDNVADEQHFKIITEAGGTLNGTTNTDRTNYFETVPVNQLEKMLWLESDRMGFLVDSVTQEKFEVQRETVKNERGQRIDNRPYGRVNELVSAALYPVNHPYSWPVIGFMDDLNRVDVNDLKDFFLTWYGPNNATITIGGNIEPAKTLALVKKYFGSIPKGPAVAMPQKAMVTLDQDRYISLEDNVQLPMISMTLPTVYVRHADEAPLDVLAQILGGGKTSILYKNMVKTQDAVYAGVGHPCAELACTLSFRAYLNPDSGKTLADLEQSMRQALVEFEQRGVQDDDLIKISARMESSFIFGLQSVSGKVSQLAANETFTGNPNYIEQDIKRYTTVTKADVIRVFNQYVKNKAAVIMSVVPKGQLNAIAAKDNFVSPQRDLSNIKQVSAQQLLIRRATDNFDRSVMPKVGNIDSIQVPQMWQQQLANGIDVLGSQSLETPTTSMLLKIPAGHYYESKNKAGTASLLASMLNESTTTRSNEMMSNELQKLGSSVSFSASNQYLFIDINSLSNNFPQTLALVKEKLLQPAFLASEFSRLKTNAIQGAINSKKDAGYLASTAYRQLLHADDIAATSGGGNETTLKTITLDDVKDFYQHLVKPSDAQIILVSNLPQQQLTKELKILDTWQGKSTQLELKLAPPTTKAGVIYLVNKDQAAQSAIRIGKRALKHDINGDYYKSGLMNFTLGGAFNSRINLNLREDKGYTYGASSYFNGNKFSGTFTVGAEVRSDVTDKSIIEIVKEIKQYANEGISDEELQFMRNAVNQRDALKYETPSAKLAFLAQILEYNLAPDFVKTRANIVKTISKQEINTLAKQQLKIEEMIIVVVGDAKTLRPQLTALGYEVVDYSI